MPERLRGIRRVVDGYPDRMLVGELYLLDLVRFVGYLNTFFDPIQLLSQLYTTY